MNLLLIHGTAAARTMATTNDKAMALADSDPNANPHLKYSDANAQGFGVALVTATQVTAVLTTVQRPVTTAAPCGEADRHLHRAHRQPRWPHRADVHRHAAVPVLTSDQKSMRW